LQNQGHSRNRNHHELNNSPNILPDQIELKDIRELPMRLFHSLATFIAALRA